MDEEIIKSVGAFGGGIASSGSVCGTLLGGIALISTIHSRGNPEDKENPRIWGLSHKFMKKFNELTEQYGGSNCTDIARVNWKDKEEVREYYSDPSSRRKLCIELVGDAAYALGELLEKEAERDKKS